MVSDLQSNVSISNGVISGSLANISDYTGFSGRVSEQSGHYLALKFTADEGASVTVELLNGTLGHPVALDEDMNIVLKIADKDAQSIKIVATKDNASSTKTYALTGLTLE